MWTARRRAVMRRVPQNLNIAYHIWIVQLRLSTWRQGVPLLVDMARYMARCRAPCPNKNKNCRSYLNIHSPIRALLQVAPLLNAKTRCHAPHFTKTKCFRSYFNLSFASMCSMKTRAAALRTGKRMRPTFFTLRKQKLQIIQSHILSRWYFTFCLVRLLYFHSVRRLNDLWSTRRRVTARHVPQKSNIADHIWIIHLRLSTWRKARNCSPAYAEVVYAEMVIRIVNPQTWRFNNNSLGLPHAQSFSVCMSSWVCFVRVCFLFYLSDY